MPERDKYTVYGVNLEKIKNKNELRVIKEMPGVLEEFQEYQPDPLDIEDIYALTLNSLPARYVQQGAIVLREPVTETMIRDELRNAIYVVRARPKHGAE
jgi:hypothetical protein